MPGDLELVIGTKDSQLDLDIEGAGKSIATKINKMIIKEIEKELNDDIDKWYKRDKTYRKNNVSEYDKYYSTVERKE